MSFEGLPMVAAVIVCVGALAGAIVALVGGGHRRTAVVVISTILGLVLLTAGVFAFIMLTARSGP